MLVLFMKHQSLLSNSCTVLGGNGGRGGDVILECSPAVWDFSCLQHHVVCGNLFYPNFTEQETA